MHFGAAVRGAVLRAVWTVAAVCLAGVSARAEIVDYDFSGRIVAETRWYPQSGLFPGQRAHATGFLAEPELYLEDDRGRSFNLTSFFRYDSADPRRTHADLREAYVLMYGQIGNDEWELRLGVDRVFWGVAESRHLVDIVNQTDLIEHPDEEEKLGQAHGPSDMVGRLGRGRSIRVAIPPRAYVSGAQGPSSQLSGRRLWEPDLREFGRKVAF